MSKHAKELLEAGSKLISSATAGNQANSVEKVMETIISELVELTKAEEIDVDTLFKLLNGLSVDKDYTFPRGQKRSVKIKFGE